MKLKARRNNIVVRVVTRDRSEGGIYLPEGMDHAKGPLLHGVVLDVGPDVQGLDVGSEVLYSKYGSRDVDVDDEVHSIVMDEDVLAVAG